MQPLRAGRAGFTLVQAIIVIALIGVGLQSIVMVSNTTAGAVKTNMIAAELESRGQAALQQVKMVLRATRSSDVTPVVSAPFSSERIDFQRAKAIVDGETQWCPPERILLQYAPGEVDDGLDNDGNGLFDDCQIVWTQDVGGANETTSVLVTHVSELMRGEIRNNADDNGNGLRDEPGFSLDFTDPTATLLNIRLTIGKVDTGGVLIERTFETSIQVRN